MSLGNSMSLAKSMREELRESLRLPLPEISPKYFYDDVGSALFDRITDLPEYYLTRAETAILEAHAPDLISRLAPIELLELGSGYSTKTRLLLDAMRATGKLRRYLPFDFSEAAMAESVRRVGARYPGVAIQVVIGDFESDLGTMPQGDHRLVAFLGSTIGNLPPDRSRAFLRSLGQQLGPRDAFLLGVDLVKDRAILEAAYNDAEGVTAEFNLNVLRVLNGRLSADFPLDAFEHVAFYDEQHRWIEMRLRACHSVSVRLRGLDDDDGTPFVLELGEGEEIRTEISRKFARPEVEELLRSGQLHLDEWITDPRGWFAVALASRRG